MKNVAMNQARLSELFGGRERFEVLRTLYLNPARQYTNKELAQVAAVNPGNAHKLLLRWSEIGLASRHVDGRNIRYQASSDPLLQGLQDLFLRSDELVVDLKAALPETAEAALIFGSSARGEDKAASDIDVLVLGDNLSEIKVNAALRPVGRKHHRTINASVYSKNEFLKLVTAEEAFALSVMSQPVILLKGTLHGVT
jgi:Polymerase beta, Nucleotidyltransferase